MLGSTGKVLMSLASSMGAGSERGSLKPSPCCSACHLQLVYRLDDLVEFALQAVVVADVEIAAEQRVEGLIEVGARGFQMSGLIVGLAGGVFLLSLRDHGVGGIGLRRGSGGLRHGRNRRRNLGFGRLLGDQIGAGEKEGEAEKCGDR